VSRLFHEQIDWRRPWLQPFEAAAVPILQAPDWRHALNTAAARAGLRNHRGMPLRFVAQGDLPREVAYEAFISSTGCVPTRDNLHDFFNAMVWLTWPNVKQQLNALQAAEIVRSPAASRGKLRDAATIFDENAAVLVTRDMGLADTLRAHRWRDLFVANRGAFGRDYEVRLFGHALMEKLVTPYKSITAHAWVVAVDDGYFSLPATDRAALIDTRVSAQLTLGLRTADFTPLPVLGVPGWWAQDEAFYADAGVFRPKRDVMPEERESRVSKKEAPEGAS